MYINKNILRRARAEIPVDGEVPWPRSLCPGSAPRVFYVAKFEEAIYVLHAFEKRTRQTPQPAIDLARKRFADLVRRRGHQSEVK